MDAQASECVGGVGGAGGAGGGGAGSIHGGAAPPLAPQAAPHALGHAPLASHLDPHRQMGPRRRFNQRTTQHERLPLDEAAKRELASSPYKTPVSVLQEVLARRGTMPKYELIQVEGMIHEPTFSYRVTVADYVAMGTGRSKKEAKHAAAKALLDKLTGAVPADAPTNGTAGEPMSVAVPPYSADKMMLGNPVGWLQEMCMSRRWPPPLYETEHEEAGLPHERQFTMACVLFKMREVGSGKSKKLAKRQAAHKMWAALEDAPAHAHAHAHLAITLAHDLTLHDQPDDDISKRVASVSARYADLKDSKISTLTTSHSHKVSQFHKHLKQNIGPSIAKLQVTSLSNKEFNFVQFLQAIAAEQQFEVTYVDIEEKSVAGRSQCLVQLSTLPVAVCHGCGATGTAAQAAAARNALEYLKIMTKK